MTKSFNCFILFLIFIFSMQMTNFSQQTPPVELGVSQTLARWRAANYSDVRYKLNITLEKGASLMKGSIEIRVNLIETGAKNDLILDWRTTQFANDKDKPFANVLAVNDVIDILYSVANEHIIIPKGALKTGENVIKIQFASPVKTSGAAITRYVDKEDGAEYIYSLFVPSDASTAFPVFDQPDLKARFTLEVTSKTFDCVISNAIGKNFDYNTNTDRFTFSETEPISTYIFAFAAGDFVSIQENPATDAEGNPVKALSMAGDKDNFRVFVRRSQYEKFKQHSKEVFRLNREGVKFLENYFDYKFPFPKYDLVLIPEFPFGGMEHAGATFLRESSVIFPTEPTKNDYISRATLIFHEAAHQWFGDTVTMRWFDDLWLKEGFATFVGYKTLEKVMPEYNAWKVFYERSKQAAYRTDVTRGTTPIYQEIANLSAAKSAYGNIVYSKAPSFLRQAEFYLGEDKFRAAVRAFLKKNEFANAEWSDLVSEFQNAGWMRDESVYRNLNAKDKEKSEEASRYTIKIWAESWVKQKGMPIIRGGFSNQASTGKVFAYGLNQRASQEPENGEYKPSWTLYFNLYIKFPDGRTQIKRQFLDFEGEEIWIDDFAQKQIPIFVFPNYQDYGYGIFLLDEKSRAYILKNIQNEKDDFLRSMMWGSLWDSVRFSELAPEEYVKLVIKNINVETDESTIAGILGRVSTAMNYYLSEKQTETVAPQVEKLLIGKIKTAPTVGQKITYFRALQSIGTSEQTKRIFKDLLTGKSKLKDVELKTKDKFDLVTQLIILGDKEALGLLTELEKTETDDAAKRYAYAARAGIPTKENKAKYWNDFVNNKEISENWVEAAFAVWNSPKHAPLTLPFLEKALAELPNLKRNRKIFFVNGWLGAFIGGQKSEEALNIVNKFLDDNPDLDKDLRLKILENVDNLERAVKIREKFSASD